MKKILSAVFAMAALALATLTADAQGVTKGYYPSFAAATNTIASATTNTTTAVTVIPVKSGLNLAIQPTFNLAGAGTSAVVFKFGASVDGTNYTAAAQTISVTANGTNTVSTTANWIVGSIGFYRLETVENPNASAINNFTIAYVAK